MLNGGAVSWRSGKQSSIAQSTMESEYMAAAEASNEAVWLREFVIELGVFPSMRDPVNIIVTTLVPLQMQRIQGSTPQSNTYPVVTMSSKSMYRMVKSKLAK